MSPSRSGVNEENEKLPEAKRRDKAKQKRQKRRPTQPVSVSDVQEARDALEEPEVMLCVSFMRFVAVLSCICDVCLSLSQPNLYMLAYLASRIVQICLSCIMCAAQSTLLSDTSGTVAV